MKRIAVFALTALASLIVVFALAGCSNDEQVIRDGLTEEFNQFKDLDSAAWRGTSDSLSREQLTALVDGYAFEIGTITVDGDSAVAELSLSCKQLYPTMKKVEDRLATEDTSSLAEAEYLDKVNEILLDEMKNASPVTTQISIACEKTGNTWTVSDTSVAEYTNALLGPQ
jgi:hypothetical protein